MYSILVVDDDRETCRFITELIAADDRHIVSEQTPADALRRFRSERVDLMVSDINLNASHSGLDLLRAFRTENPDGQVLLISGFGTLETAIAAVRAGAFDYISKPFNIAEVKAMVARALAHVGQRRCRAAGGAGAAGACAGAHRPDGRDARGLQADCLRRRLERAGLDSRRERHRQGARVARHPRQWPARHAAVCRHQLRRYSRNVAGVGALRAHSRLVHWRCRRPEGHHRAGHGRHGTARRDRRDVPGAAGAPAADDRGRGSAARRRRRVRSRSMRVSSRRRTAISRRKSRRSASARISSIA